MTAYRFARGHRCGEDELPQWIGPELWADGRRIEGWGVGAAEDYARAAIQRIRESWDPGYAPEAETWCLDTPDPFRAAALASLFGLHAARAAGGEVAITRERAAQVAFFRDRVLS